MSDAAYQPGEVLLGKYRIDSVLGEGGMGVVLAATHLRIGNPVALKLLQPEVACQPLFVERFEREARAALAIKSEHVARVLDVEDLEDGLPVIVMERLEGHDLAHEIRRQGRIPVPEAASLLLQACEALAEAHRLGIVHRDLKPGNLFLTSRADGSPLLKVMDFGIAKAALGRDDRSITRTQDVVGSPLYMPPEQIRASRDVDQRADIWALGVLLYEMVSGQTPFEGPNSSAVLAAVAADRPLPLRLALPSASRTLRTIVDRCLEKNPKDRFANVAEFANALRPLAPSNARASVERIGRIVRASLDEQPKENTGLVQAALPEASTLSGLDVSPTGRRNLTPTKGTDTLLATTNVGLGDSLPVPSRPAPETTPASSPVPRPLKNRRLRRLAIVAAACLPLGFVWFLSRSPPSHHPASAPQSPAVDSPPVDDDHSRAVSREPDQAETTPAPLRVERTEAEPLAPVPPPSSPTPTTRQNLPPGPSPKAPRPGPKSEPAPPPKAQPAPPPKVRAPVSTPQQLPPAPTHSASDLLQRAVESRK